jgi:hypothetical protein
MPFVVYTNKDIVLEIRRSNQLLEAILAKVAAILNVIAVEPNAPPQYTGPTDINDLVVGVGRQLEGFDPDGDSLTWSIDPANAEQGTVSPEGVLVMTTPYDGAITVWLDDGKTTT